MLLAVCLPYMLCPQGLHPGSKQRSVPGPCGPLALQGNSQGQAPGNEGTGGVDEGRQPWGNPSYKVSSSDGLSAWKG